MSYGPTLNAAAVLLLSEFACAGTVVLGFGESYGVSFAGLLLVGHEHGRVLGADVAAHDAGPGQAVRVGVQVAEHNPAKQALFAVSVIDAILNVADPAGRMALAFVIVSARRASWAAMASGRRRIDGEGDVDIGSKLFGSSDGDWQAFPLLYLV